MVPLTRHPLRRALRVTLLLLLAGAPLGAQSDTTARPTPSVVVAQPAGATRQPSADTTARVRAAAGAVAQRDIVSDVDPVLTTLAGIAVGAVSGAMFDDACYGGGDGLALRGGLAAAAVSIPFYHLTKHERDPEAEARAARRWDRAPRVLLLASTAALAGVALGAPIGAVEGARRPEACGGSAGAGALRTAGHMAAGTLAIGLVGMTFEWLASR